MSIKPKSPMSQKIRLDVAMVERGLSKSRTRAQALIMAGLVYRDTERLDKASFLITREDPIAVKCRDYPWVSRGGVKLAHGLLYFGFDVTGMVCIDVGASTGGFTNVLLHNGAGKVYAVDVGYGQLDWKLRNDDRVVVLERTNARELNTELVSDNIDVVVCDVSFIGLRKALPASMMLTKSSALLIALIKPQFEVGKDQVGKGGIVRDSKLHEVVCNRIWNWINDQPGWKVIGVEKSPISGQKGNVEFLIGAKRLS